MADLEPGDWFVPISIRGEDLHSQIPEALARGAAGFLHEPGRGPWVSLEVSQMREAVYALAHAHRQTLARIPFVALTGSNGKTTVKEMIAAIFSAAGSTLSTRGNFNTKIGIAADLLRLTAEHRFGVFELGARREGDLEIPLRLLQPQTALCLNINEAHLGEFGGLEALARTKVSIYGQAATTTFVAPTDDPRILEGARARAGRLIRFGALDDADIRVEGISFDREAGRSRIDLQIGGATERFEVSGWHRTHGANVAAAVAVGLAHDLSLSQIRSGLHQFRPARGRFDVFRAGSRWIIDDSFNANPTSLREGLRTLRELFPNEEIDVVLGSMLELGPDSASLHFQCGAWVQEHLRPRHLATIGEEAKDLARGALQAGLSTERTRAFESAATALTDSRFFDSRVVYIKGSKALGLRRLIEAFPGARPLWP